MEGAGGVATSSGAPASVLHRIKVKEEAKDCAAGALQSNVSPPPPPQRSLAIGAIATITISSGCGELTPAPTSAAVAAVEPVDLDLKSGARAKGELINGELCFITLIWRRERELRGWDMCMLGLFQGR